jgi:hypothetical protein
LDEIDQEYEGRHTDTRFVRLLEQGNSRQSAHTIARDPQR